LGALSFRNSTDTAANAAEIKSVAVGAHGAAARGAKLVFSTTPSGGTATLASMTIEANGNVGIGTTSTAVAALEVNGAIKMGSMAACTGSEEGSQRYNSGLKIMEFCDGIAWQSFTGGGLVPSGAVMAFDLASCPTGWTAFAAGQDRVIVGAGGSYALNATGGANTATSSSDGNHSHTAATGSTTLSIAQIPAHAHGVSDPGHTHTAWTDAQGAHAHNVSTFFTNNPMVDFQINDYNWDSIAGTDNAANGFYANKVTDTQGSHSHNVGIGAAATGISIQNQGGGGGHTHPISADGTHAHTVDVRQPYVALRLCRKN
jgi:hypothetical protein